MQIIKKDGRTTSAEVLKPVDVLSKISNRTFRIPMQADELYQLLARFYVDQVWQRGFACIGDEATKSHLRHFSAILTQSNGVRGIMLCGNCGNGKTTLLYAFRAMLNWLGDIGRLEELEQTFGEKPGIVITDSKQLARLASDYREFERVQKLNMLAIEDMGKEPLEVMVYGNVIAPVQDIIEYRYDKRLFTFITTNLSPQEITQRYGMRVGDRLKEMVSKIVFENDSYRQVIANQNRQKNGSSTG